MTEYTSVATDDGSYRLVFDFAQVTASNYNILFDFASTNTMTHNPQEDCDHKWRAARICEDCGSVDDYVKNSERKGSSGIRQSKDSSSPKVVGSNPTPSYEGAEKKSDESPEGRGGPEEQQVSETPPEALRCLKHGNQQPCMICEREADQ